jgi:signal transduction histidine kinase
MWIKRFGRSLAWRISVWYALGLTVSFLLVGLFAVQVAKEGDLHADRDEIREEFEQEAERCRKLGAEAYGAAVRQEPRAMKTVLVHLCDAEGRTRLLAPAFAESQDETNHAAERLKNARSPGWHRLDRLDAKGRNWQAYAEQMPDGGWLHVAKSDRHWHESRKLLQQAVLPIVGCVALVTLIGAALLTARTLRPIHRLIDTTRRIIQSGDMTARVPASSTGGSELDELNALFNQMLARNEGLIRGMREALDNVAHDLRTPLTRLRASAETALRDHPPSAEKRGEALADAVEESERTLVMLRALTDISEAEHGAMRLRFETLTLAELAAVAVDLYEHVAEDRGIKLVLRAPPELRVLADRVRLQQVIANLLDNALKYSPPNTTVAIEAGWDDDLRRRVWLRVRDQGIGIAAHDLPRIWDRLYRGDRSRSERGSGLGLSLVKAVVEAHGGSVKVVSAPNEGSTFTIVLAANDNSVILP